ncbi:MAG: TIGR00730 family Rossman fold protein [Verrucomicrobiota bacterium]|nr:TIGR00730 family Rossman fold protein [Verrucomicrobiota bacterium]
MLPDSLDPAGNEPATEHYPVHNYPEPVKAYKNLEFLTSSAARSIRIQCELTEPALRFKKHHINNTLVFFGSARIPPKDEGQKNLAAMEEQFASLHGDAVTDDIRAALSKAKALQRASKYYEDARQLARELTEWSYRTIHNPKERFYICSGGGPGIMEAANRGAREAGGLSISLGISLPFEQHINQYSDNDLSFEFHYFFVRKYWFLYLAKALVAFPGGFGTMDELFEMLTLIQTHKTTKHVPVILYGKEFWNQVLNMEALVDWGVISPNDLNLFKICDSVEEARDMLIKDLTEHHLKKA